MAGTSAATRDELLAQFVALVSLTGKQIDLLQSLMQLAFIEGEASGMRQISDQITKKEDTAHENH